MNLCRCVFLNSGQMLDGCQAILHGQKETLLHCTLMAIFVTKYGLEVVVSTSWTFNTKIN